MSNITWKIYETKIQEAFAKAMKEEAQNLANEISYVKALEKLIVNLQKRYNETLTDMMSLINDRDKLQKEKQQKIPENKQSINVGEISKWCSLQYMGHLNSEYYCNHKDINNGTTITNYCDDSICPIKKAMEEKIITENKDLQEALRVLSIINILARRLGISDKQSMVKVCKDIENKLELADELMYKAYDVDVCCDEVKHKLPQSVNIALHNLLEARCNYFLNKKVNI